MERNILIAVFLSFLVLFVYQMVVVQPRRQAQPGPRTERSAAQPGAPTPIPRAPEAGVAQPPPPSTEPAPAVPVADEAARDVVVESDAVHAVFTNRGGVLKSWRLKKYLDAKGQPLDLVPSGLPGDPPRPFSLDLGDAALTGRLAQALFTASTDALTMAPGVSESALTFDYRDLSGLSVHKQFKFRPGAPYVIQFSALVDNGGHAITPRITWGPAIGSGANAGGSRYYTPPRAVLFADGKVQRIRANKITEGQSHQGNLPFAGVEDHYFLSAEVGGGAGLSVTYAPLIIDRPAEQGGSLQLVSYTVQYAAAPANASFFFGPKDFDILHAVSPDLVRAIDFGIFAWLVVPLLRALKWIDAFIGNYGWSIIILTVLINAAMFPLRHKSVVSMRKMQEIQPQVKAIQERYSKLKATDPARQNMNRELMDLYRERGVNPASGCLPMILTLPVLFAFYSLLAVAIELRGAPFIGWIRDLSAPDPLYITPVLMGATMVVQQRMTPTTGDPMQQKMMMFMPIMFTGMFLWAPSGLVIYWFVSNLWGIGQQYLTNRLIGPPKVHTVRPAAERRLKSVGAGKGERAAKDGEVRERAR